MAPRKVLFALAALAVFGAIGTAAAASVVQVPVHAPSAMAGVFAQGVHTGQMSDEPLPPVEHHKSGCSGFGWGGW